MNKQDSLTVWAVEIDKSTVPRHNQEVLIFLDGNKIGISAVYNDKELLFECKNNLKINTLDIKSWQPK